MNDFDADVEDMKNDTPDLAAEVKKGMHNIEFGDKTTLFIVNIQTGRLEQTVQTQIRRRRTRRLIRIYTIANNPGSIFVISTYSKMDLSKLQDKIDEVFRMFRVNTATQTQCHL